MNVVEILICLGGVVLIAILTWVHLIMIASHYLVTKFGLEMIEDCERSLEKKDDDVSYA